MTCGAKISLVPPRRFRARSMASAACWARSRAGGLDQGNICMNLADAEQRGISENILFLAGSAINSIKNERGQYDPRLGAEAMEQALDVHRTGELRDVPRDRQAATLLAIAERNKLKALRAALRQRYPDL